MLRNTNVISNAEKKSELKSDSKAQNDIQYIECPDKILNQQDYILGQTQFPFGQFAVSPSGIIAICDKVNPTLIKLYDSGKPVGHFKINSDVCSQIAWINDSLLAVTDDIALFKYEINGKLLGKLKFEDSKLTRQYHNEPPKNVEFGSGGNKTFVRHLFTFTNDIVISTHGRAILKSDFKSKKVTVFGEDILHVTKMNDHQIACLNPLPGFTKEFKLMDVNTGKWNHKWQFKFDSMFKDFQFKRMSDQIVAGVGNGKLFFFNMFTGDFKFHRNDAKVDYLLQICSLGNNFYATLEAKFGKWSDVAEDYKIRIYNLDSNEPISTISLGRKQYPTFTLECNPVSKDLILETFAKFENAEKKQESKSSNLRCLNVGLKEYFAYLENRKNTKIYLDTDFAADFAKLSLFAKPLINIVKDYLADEAKTQTSHDTNQLNC